MDDTDMVPETATSITPIEPDYPPYADPSYVMPDEINVQATLPDGSTSAFAVSIEKVPEGTKPYYGGYRDKRTGLLYHHGSAQTVRQHTVHKSVTNLRNRDSQTYSLITKSTQLVRESGTQMKRGDLHLDDKGDVTLPARPYFSAVQLLDKQRKETLLIQCFWRGYVARAAAWSRREEIYQKQLMRVKGREEEVRKAGVRQKREIERRMNPKSVQDFEILYNELEVWRTSEHGKISSSGCDEGKKNAMVADLLAKETKLLQTIDKLKAKALKSGREKRINTMMDAMSKEKQWEKSNGNPINVSTPFTVRAAELASLYKGLQQALGSADSRLDVLLNVKWTVNEFDCALTRDIVELIDREADLLNRGRNEETLAGLRSRLSNLFLQFVETPEFNPESARFLKVPNGFEVEPIFKTLAAPSNW